MDSTKDEKIAEVTHKSTNNKKRICEENDEQDIITKKQKTENLSTQVNSSDEQSKISPKNTAVIEEIIPESINNNYPVLHSLDNISEAILGREQEALIDRLLEEMNSCVVGLALQDEIIMK